MPRPKEPPYFRPPSVVPAAATDKETLLYAPEKPRGPLFDRPNSVPMSMLPPRVTSTAPAEPAAATAARLEPAIKNFFIFLFSKKDTEPEVQGPVERAVSDVSQALRPSSRYDLEKQAAVHKYDLENFCKSVEPVPNWSRLAVDPL